MLTEEILKPIISNIDLESKSATLVTRTVIKRDGVSISMSSDSKKVSLDGLESLLADVQTAAVKAVEFKEDESI